MLLTFHTFLTFLISPLEMSKCIKVILEGYVRRITNLLGKIAYLTNLRFVSQASNLSQQKHSF
ncbi:MAG: hypothetical protein EOO34_00260 [Cyanobacteriota bacterium]|nr:MAG: hypothetical protein EOO34_00260 [Cyanobacteriota bacterium]